MALYLIPKVILLKEEEHKEAFISFVKSMGVWGFFIMTLFNALQVVIFILPGEVFEIISGLMYGPYLGLFCVEIGIALGSFIVLGLLRLIPFSSDKLKNYLQKKKMFKSLTDSSRLEVVIFFITLIPCLPKDILLFVIPYTKIKTTRFLIINAIARVPSIITSTYFGSSLLHGNYKLAIILFTTQALIGVLGLIFNKKIMKIIYRKNKKGKTKTQ